MSRSRPTLAEGLWALAVLGYVLLHAGCATAQGNLRAAILVNNAVAQALADAWREHDVRLVAAFRRREALCPLPPDPERGACRHQAQIDTAVEYASEWARLMALSMAERAAADELEAAAACHRDGLECEGEHLRAAEGPLAALRQGLLR